MSGGSKLHRFHQPISVPGKRLLRHIPLKFVNAKVSGGGARSVNQEIPLIPFIDFLLCIVLFLLSSFSASNELPVDKTIKLPAAENTLDPVEAPVVAVSLQQILLDGKDVGSTASILEVNRLQRVERLQEMLKTQRELWEQLNPGKQHPGQILLQVDERVPALVVKSVFQTAAQSGYPSVSFIVNRGGGGGGEAEGGHH